MAENNAEAPSVASIMSNDYTPKAKAGERKGLAELGYDRTGYVSQIDPSTFTAPLDDLAATSTDSIVQEAAKYASERQNFRNKQISAQIDKEWTNLPKDQRNMMTDMFAFSGYSGNQGDFYRQLFDLGGRLTNRQVKDAMSVKLSEYSNQNAFNADAKTSQLFKADDKNVGMLFGWGENVEGDDLRYRQGRTYKAREAARAAELKAQREAALEAQRQAAYAPDRFHAY